MDGNVTNTATGTTADNGAGTQQAATNNATQTTTAAAGATTQQTAADNNTATKSTQPNIDVDKVKSEAVSALLKELGYEDVEALKTVTTKAKAEEDAKKSDLEKKDEALTAMTRQLATEREARIVAEAKNAAIKLGAKPELVDDLVIVAKAKVTKDKDINAVITEIKDSTVGDVYFVKDDNTNPAGAGTVTRGQVHKKATTQQAAQNNNNAAGGDDEAHAGTMAARLLAKRKTAKKGYYFK